LTLQTSLFGRACLCAADVCLRKGQRLRYGRARQRPRKPWRRVWRQPLLGVGRQPTEIVAAYRELFPGAAQSKIRQANAICDHVFDLLGSGPTRLSPPAGPTYQPIDWHRDFKSGHRWDPADFFRDCQYGDGADVKVPWELSRFQHLNTLGQAYVLTRDHKYAVEFVDQVEDWIRNNPVGFGVNWACTMDVAIRAASWLTAMDYFATDPAAGPHFQYRLYSSIREHGRFICHHLERSSRWFRFAVRQIAREMQSQVYDDGCHFEASTCYHRLALESFFFATVLAVGCRREPPRDGYKQVAEEVFGAEYVQKLHRMFTAVLHLLKPDGRMPQIGDNDSGRFQAFGSREDLLDMRYLLALGAVFFAEPQFKVKEFGFSEDALWIFGRQGYDTWQSLEDRSVNTIESRSFARAGWHVIRRGSDYCLVSCGRNGPEGQGGHGHNDKLSIELMIGGRDVIVDPGTYLYTPCPNDRNRFRSTGHHNTLKIDGHEQNGPLDGDVFRLPQRVMIRSARLTETAGRISFEGEIEYAGIVHARTVSLDLESSRWMIDDRMSCPARVAGEAAFHLAPHVESRDGQILDRATGKPLGRFETQGGHLETRIYDYSPQYGVSVEAQCVCVRIDDRACTAAITTTVIPHIEIDPRPLDKASP
jgi:hypothetical protein